MLNKKKIKIAIVEDDAYVNRSLLKYIGGICNSQVYPSLEFEIQSFSNAHEAIQELDDELTIMVLDYYLFNPESTEKLNGSDVFEAVKKHCPNCKVIVISSQQDPGLAVQLIKNGVHEYVDKNISSNNRIGAIIQKTLKQEIRA